MSPHKLAQAQQGSKKGGWLRQGPGARCAVCPSLGCCEDLEGAWETGLVVGPDRPVGLTWVLGKIQSHPEPPFRVQACPHKLSTSESFYEAGRAEGETEAAPQKASYFSSLCTRPSPVQRGLQMRWKLLGTTQVYEMPVTEFFPATAWFCLKWQTLLSTREEPFLPSYDIQRYSHRDRKLSGSNLVLHEVFQGSLEKAPTGT